MCETIIGPEGGKIETVDALRMIVGNKSLIVKGGFSLFTFLSDSSCLCCVDIPATAEAAGYEIKHDPYDPMRYWFKKPGSELEALEREIVQANCGYEELDEKIRDTFPHILCRSASTEFFSAWQLLPRDRKWIVRKIPEYHRVSIGPATAKHKSLTLAICLAAVRLKMQQEGKW